MPERPPPGFLDYPYRPDIYDEMCAADGRPRPHWRYVMDALRAMGAAEIEQRRQEIANLLQENGVTYNAYGDPRGRDRPWQLDVLPLLISSEEWGGIERGLTQRAELLNLVLTDLYGPRELLRKKLLPAELVYAHPGFLRQCDGITPPRRDYLPLYAADLARDTQGRLCVLRDRAQGPSGAGYVLENRLVLSRVLPSLYRDSHVHRLALFFRTLRGTLAGLAWRQGDEEHIVLLSPGPDSETYFEHVYLAKYLGYPLVQGADLAVRDGRVWLKTLDGLQPVDVILRRISDAFSDPLELRQDSYIGVAGLLQAARQRQVALANPLGNAVVENPALHEFLPGLCRYLLGENLLLPSPPTWWCGRRENLAHVLANLDKLVVRRTFDVPGERAARGQNLSAAQREALRARILADPRQFLAQEEIAYASVPVWADTRLEPRQMLLRTFLVGTDDSYMVMPGGLARVSTSPEGVEFFGQSGGLSKDLWVLASEPEKQISLLPSTEHLHVHTGEGEVSSRVAENLFWLGRYAERSDAIIRLLRSVLLYVVEQPGEYAQSRSVAHHMLCAVTYLTETYPGFVGEGAEARLQAPETELLSVFLDKARVGSLSYNLSALLYSARSVRDRISPDIWRVFNEIDQSLTVLQAQREAPFKPSDALSEMLYAALEELNHLVIAFAGFTGLAMDSMTHGQGWRFLIIGRRLERAQHTLQLLRATLSSIAHNESALLEQVLNICDSQMTYRRRYRTQALPMSTLELLLLDDTNPRAAHFQLDHLHEDIRALPRKTVFAYRSEEERLILDALTQLRLSDLAELVQPDSTGSFRANLDQLLVRLVHLLPKISDALSHSYFSHTERPRQLVRFGGD